MLPPTGEAPRPLAALREVGVLALFVGAAMIATWPLSRHLASWAPGSGDSLETTWIFGWAAHAVRHHPAGLLDGSVFNANIFYPERLTLAYTESFLGLSMPVAPLIWLTSNPLLAYNVVTVGLYAVGGFTTYLLVRQLTSYRPASIIAGLAFTLAPYRISQIEHAHVIAVHLMPIVLLLLLRLRRDSSWRVLIAMGFAVGLQMWSSFTGATIMAAVVSTWGIWELARRRRRALGLLGRAGVAMVLGMVLAIPVIKPYMDLRKIHPEFKHPEAAVLEFSGTPTSYLSPPPRNSLIRSPYDRLSSRYKDSLGYWEKFLFPGFVLSGSFILAIGALILGRLRRLGSHGTHRFGDPRGSGPEPGVGSAEPGVGSAGSADPAADVAKAAGTTSFFAHVGLFLLIGAVGFVLSLGPRLGGTAQGIPLPFTLITKLGFSDFARVPARFGTLVPFAMAVVVGLAIGAARAPWRKRLATVSLALLAIELFLPTLQPMPAPIITAADRAIRQRSGAVLGLPTAEFDPNGAVMVETIPREAVHLYLSMGHFRPIINGYGSFHPDSFWEVVKAVQDFPSVAGMRILHKRGVKTVVVQTDLIRGTHWDNVVERLNAWPGAVLVGRDRGVRVYDISDAAEVAPTPDQGPQSHGRLTRRPVAPLCGLAGLIGNGGSPSELPVGAIRTGMRIDNRLAGVACQGSSDRGPQRTRQIG